MTHRNTNTVEILKPAHLLAVCLCVVLGAGILQAQTDPGPRGGPAGAGGAFPTLNANEVAFFNQALTTFNEVQSVTGNIPGEGSLGLGPTFNGNSCAQCHAEPAVGGTSPGLNSRINARPNPQVALATLDGATNTVPSFVTAGGPVREARFTSTDTTNIYAPLDGGVHGLFTIKGRSDAPGCTLAQPDFAGQLAAGNVTFRIPTPLFGLGLVENTPDATLRANLAANASAKAALGILGRFNTNGRGGMALRTTVAIEGGSQTRAAFTWDGTGHRLDFIEGSQRLVKESQLVGVESWKGAAGSSRSSAGSRISLGLKYSSAKDHTKAHG